MLTDWILPYLWYLYSDKGANSGTASRELCGLKQAEEEKESDSGCSFRQRHTLIFSLNQTLSRLNRTCHQS